MTSSTTLRVDQRQRALLKQLADDRDATMIDTLDAALEALRRQDFFAAMERAEIEMRADSDAWTSYEDDARPWLDAT